MSKYRPTTGWVTPRKVRNPAYPAKNTRWQPRNHCPSMFLFQFFPKNVPFFLQGRCAHHYTGSIQGGRISGNRFVVFPLHKQKNGYHVEASSNAKAATHYPSAADRTTESLSPEYPGTGTTHSR